MIKQNYNISKKKKCQDKINHNFSILQTGNINVLDNDDHKYSNIINYYYLLYYCCMIIIIQTLLLFFFWTVSFEI